MLEPSPFRLQPAPYHRYKENRKYRILTASDSLTEGKTDTENEKIEMQNRYISSSQVVNGNTVDFRSDNNDSTRTTETVIDANQKQRVESETRMEEEQTESVDHTGTVLTSPVRNNLLNSAFYNDLAIEGLENSSRLEAPPSATTSSFSSAAHSSRSLVVRRRTGQTSVSSLGPQPRPTHSSTETEVGDICVLNLPPVTPMTPRSLSALHTPADMHFDERSALLAAASDPYDAAPLSATLRRLGAARESKEADVEDEGNLHKSIDSATSFASGWERKLSERAAAQRRAHEAGDLNRQAVLSSADLFAMRGARRSSSSSFAINDIIRKQTSTIQLTRKIRSRSPIQSTARGAKQSAERSTLRRMSTILSSYLFGGTKSIQKSEKGSNATTATLQSLTGKAIVAKPVPVAAKQRGDGWGGLCPRLSWFPDIASGPLMSPTVANAPTALRPLRLQARKEQNDEDVWIDENEVQPFSALQDNAVEVNDPPIQKLRVRFPSYLPKPRREDSVLRLDRPPLLDNVDALTVKYTKTSAEGCPDTRARSDTCFGKVRTIASLLVVFSLLGGVTIILAVYLTTSARRSHGDHQAGSNVTLSQDNLVSSSEPSSHPYLINHLTASLA